MDIIRHLKVEIDAAVAQSILLRPDMRVAIKAKTASCSDVNVLRNVLNMLLREKDYIIKYLQQVIHVDTTGLTVYKLRELMQKSYLKSLHQNEAGSTKVDHAEAESFMSKLSF